MVRRPGPRILLLLALGGVLGAALLGEIALRVAGFRQETVPILEVGWPEPHVIHDEFRPDYDLFWVTRDYYDLLAQARATRPDIVFMGDSCTQFGTYPRLTLERLAAAGSSVRTGVKLGVGGWSSQQGLTQLRRDVLPLHPRVITVYYGWNDHWIAFGPPDDRARPPLPAAMYRHLRLAQLYAQARAALLARQSAGSLRVSVDQYKANLREMARLAGRQEIRVVFITAPSGHVAGAEPAYLAKRHVRRLEDVVPLHARYVEATREISAETNATLCDAEATFNELPNPRRWYFRYDGIHLSPLGDAALATIVQNCIERAIAR